MALSQHGASLIRKTESWFEENGPLALNFENYQPRAEQMSMARAVAETLSERDTLIVEAGTGTGKSMAYLVPAALSGGKVIVSTGTKNLQDQLYNKDLPSLLRLMTQPVSTSLLKGRANYLCLHRLKLAMNDPRLQAMGQDSWTRLRQLREWGLTSHDGDLNAGGAPTLGAIPLARVTSTSENCLGSECPEYNDCFVVKARRRAQEADIVVVNHHLLLADLTLREEGFAELLPEADAVILDEAHQLPQVASQFFGRRYSYYQLTDLARDLRAEMRAVASDMPDLSESLADYERACVGLQQRLAGGMGRVTWQDEQDNHAVVNAVEEYVQAVQDTLQHLEPVRSRSKGLEQAAERLQGIADFFSALRNEESPLIRWLERSERNFILHLTPLDIADNFRQIMQSTPAAWVMTSATLSVDQGFKHFSAQVGAESARELILESPFDYTHNTLLYLPNSRFEPNHPGYLEGIAENIEAVVRASGGGVFVLCTSFAAVNYLSEYLRRHVGQQVFAQGERPRHELLDHFRKDGHAVLVGTSSFWEGVDVRGPALRVVVIDRLPFAHPDDPILRSRLNSIREQGGNPFGDYQVPQAVITLKQGVGRLIRDHQDRGVIMLCDPRISSKGYGRRFLNSLPQMPHTRSLSEVQDFLAHITETA